jgi:hypothetical protein
MPSEEALAEVRRLAERRLSAEEFDAWVNAPMGEDERAEILSLIEWFTRRYPTPAARLAQARASYQAAERLQRYARGTR